MIRSLERELQRAPVSINLQPSGQVPPLTQAATSQAGVQIVFVFQPSLAQAAYAAEIKLMQAIAQAMKLGASQWQIVEAADESAALEKIKSLNPGCVVVFGLEDLASRVNGGDSKVLRTVALQELIKSPAKKKELWDELKKMG